MDIYAKIENGICTNIAVFDDKDTAIDFGYPILLPDGYGIGDLYNGESWSHVSVSEPESQPDVWDELATAIREGVNEV